jgi:cytochrome c-type biogenesis protein CcsB
MTADSSAILSIAVALIAGATGAYVTCLLKGRQVVSRLSTGLGLAALLCLSIGLAIRAIETGHWPLSNSYEFAMTFAWCILVIYLVLERVVGTRALGASALAIALLIVGYAQILAPESTRIGRPLLPALQTVWLQLHVTTGAVAYGAFAVSCGASAMYLIGQRAPGFLHHFPGSATADDFSSRALAVGYPAMSLVLITGAIWAQLAWGRYWSWDIKETWTLITWLVYTLLFHLRAIRGWRGWPIASLSIVGFLCVIFTLWGVGWLAGRVGLESLHLY